MNSPLLSLRDGRFGSLVPKYKGISLEILNLHILVDH